MNRCACRCGRFVRGTWSQGHNRRGVPPTNKRGWTESNGYRFIYMPAHPQAKASGYCREHRLVVEQRLGRYLLPSEDVRHINGVKNDNRYENLEVMTHGDHAKHHVQVAEHCLDCGAPHRARGLCASCYGKYQRAGKAMPIPATRGSRWSPRRGDFG
jgi:hypothetical protein